MPNFPVLAGLGRTDRTVTWTKPLLPGLHRISRTGNVGLLIRRFWVQVPGGAPHLRALTRENILTAVFVVPGRVPEWVPNFHPRRL